MSDSNLVNGDKSPEAKIANPNDSIDVSNLDTPKNLSLVEISLENSTPGSQETTQDKLSRNADVLFGGIYDGTKNSLTDAAKDPTTLLKLGGSVGAGALLTVLSARKGKFKIAANGLGIGLGGLFAKDVYDHGSMAKTILDDSWNNPHHHEQNRALMANTLGPFLADTALYTAGGLAGVRLAHKPPSIKSLQERIGAPKESPKSLTQEPTHVEFPLLELGQGGKAQTMRLPKEAPLAEAVSNTRGAVGKAEVLKSVNGQLEGGSATVVAISRDGLLATNKHLIDDAINIKVFDPKGQAHDAHVVAHGPDWRLDLAILQLDNPKSFKAFQPVKPGNANVQAVSEGTQVAFLGHTEGLNTMHVSRGSYGGKSKGQADLISCNANVSGGNCGSALVDMQGTLLGIMRGDIGNSARNVVAVPSKHIGRLIQERPPVMQNTVSEAIPATGQLRKPQTARIEVDNPALAKQNIDEIFGISPERGLADDFFHMRARKATLETGTGPKEITMSTTYESPQFVSVRPTAIDGRVLRATDVYPGTEIPIRASNLRIKFDGDYAKASIETVDDVAGLLMRGLEFKQGRPSYLSGLEPMPMPKPKADSRLNFDYLYGASTVGLKGLNSQLAR